jgi:hypothetical protein
LDNPKRHHTVPKFYLSGFADGKKLGAVNVRTGARHTTSVTDATGEVNFYTVRDHTTDPNGFEAALSQLEGVAAAVHRAIIEGQWPLAPADRAAFASFMTLQFLRVQSHRWQMQHAIAASLRDLAMNNPEEFDRVLALPGAPSREAIAGADLPSLVSPAVHIQQRSTMVPQLVEHILGRPWELVRFDSPSLLTSDEPLTRLANPAELPGVVGGSILRIYPKGFSLRNRCARSRSMTIDTVCSRRDSRRPSATSRRRRLSRSGVCWRAMRQSGTRGL